MFLYIFIVISDILLLHDAIANTIPDSSNSMTITVVSNALQAIFCSDNSSGNIILECLSENEAHDARYECLPEHHDEDYSAMLIHCGFYDSNKLPQNIQIRMSLPEFFNVISDFLPVSPSYKPSFYPGEYEINAKTKAKTF